MSLRTMRGTAAGGAMLASALACTLAAGTLQAQDAESLTTVSRQQLDAVKVVLAQEAAWNAGDMDGYLHRFKDAPDTVAMLGGPVRGMANIASAFHINYPGREAMGQLDYSDVEARALGDNFTLATGKYHLNRTKKGGGPADGTFTEILEKTAAGWQVVFTEST